jgi:hypothetical protein
LPPHSISLRFNVNKGLGLGSDETNERMNDILKDAKEQLAYYVARHLQVKLAIPEVIFFASECII